MNIEKMKPELFICDDPVKKSSPAERKRLSDTFNKVMRDRTASSAATIIISTRSVPIG